MFWRRRKRLDEEIESHLAEEIADNIARGMEPVSARNAAVRTFGSIEVAKETVRELDPFYWLDTLWQDIRFAFRIIARNRWSSLTILATLTVGIALNVSVFSVLNAFLLRPWVRNQPETFVSLIPRFSGQYQLRFSDSSSMSQPDYLLYRRSAKSLDSLAAYRNLGVILSGEESGGIRAGLISCNLFDVIRPGQPLAGRYFTSEECAKPMQIAILSEALWRTRFNAELRIIGRVIHLNRLPFVVVGIAPTFSGRGNERDVWVPYTALGVLRPADDYFGDRGAHWLTVVGRRNPAYSLAQVQQELTILARHADQEMPGRVTSLTVTDGSLLQDPEMRARAPLIFAATLGTSALLLMLACVNVTTLLLSRSAARRHETAVRLSLGAGRFRLLRQLLTESLVLSAIATALSLVIAQRAPAFLWNFLIFSPPPFDLTPDWRVLLYCLAVALTAAVIAGLSPAVESVRPQLSASLKNSVSGPRRATLRNVLVASQIALSLVLLVQASLFVRAQRRFFSYDPGFETKQVVSLTLASVNAGFEPSPSFYQRLESRVNALPGVIRTSYASIPPWSGRNSTELSAIDGKPIPATRDYRRDPARRVVSSGYFSALDLRLIRGRYFSNYEQGMPAVISEAMARRYWPDQDPIGHSFNTSVVHEVIGVCRDVQSVRYMEDDGPFYYVPLDMTRNKPPSMVIRVAGDAQAVAATVRDIVREMDSRMASTVVTLASAVETQGERVKPVMICATAVAVLALLLALTGVYGVVANSVSQRVREIGIRVALGARPGSVVWLVLRSAAAPLLAGLAAGIGLAVVASANIEAVLFGVNPHDSWTLIIVPALLLAAALIAVWLPARRAAALEPVRSLRCE